MRKMILKGRSLPVFLLLVLAALTFQFHTTRPAHSATDLCGISDQACVTYLETNGYTNVRVIGYDGCDRICDTSNIYDTKVNVSDTGIITGYEDLPH